MEKLYTMKEAKQMLGVQTKTIQRWDRENKIKVVRTPGGRRRIPESEVQRIRQEGVMNTNIKIDKMDSLIRRKPRDSEKVEIFCRMAEAAVEEGIIFEGNKIVEILPWDED